MALECNGKYPFSKKTEDFEYQSQNQPEHKWENDNEICIFKFIFKIITRKTYDVKYIKIMNISDHQTKNILWKKGNDLDFLSNKEMIWNNPVITSYDVGVPKITNVQIKNQSTEYTEQFIFTFKGRSLNMIKNIKFVAYFADARGDTEKHEYDWVNPMLEKPRENLLTYFLGNTSRAPSSKELDKHKNDDLSVKINIVVPDLYDLLSLLSISQIIGKNGKKILIKHNDIQEYFFPENILIAWFPDISPEYIISRNELGEQAGGNMTINDIIDDEYRRLITIYLQKIREYLLFSKMSYLLTSKTPYKCIQPTKI